MMTEGKQAGYSGRKFFTSTPASDRQTTKINQLRLCSGNVRASGLIFEAYREGSG